MHAPGVRREYEYSYGRQNWFSLCAQYEADKLKNDVVFFDQHSFAKYTGLKVRMH